MNLHILIHAADDVETNSDLAAKHDHENDSTNDNSCPQCSHKFVEKQQLIVHVAKHGLKVQRWSDKNIERENCENSEEVVDLWLRIFMFFWATNWPVFHFFVEWY